MAMSGAQAGGISLYYNPLRDKEFNEGEKANPGSLYEPHITDFTRVGFPTMYDGHAIKFLMGWLGHLAVHEPGYSVVVMKRDPAEIMESYQESHPKQARMYNPEQWIKEYPARFEELVRTLKNRRDVKKLLVVEFKDLLQHPETTFARFAQDCDWPLDPEKAATMIERGTEDV